MERYVTNEERCQVLLDLAKFQSKSEQTRLNFKINKKVFFNKNGQIQKTMNLVKRLSD